MNYDWNFSLVLMDARLWREAAIATLMMCGGALLIAVPLGLLWTVLRLNGPTAVRIAVICVIEFLRVSAPVVLIIWSYFALPIISGININAFTAGSLAIGLQGSAFFSEIARAGINGVDRGQFEAAKAIGMRTGAAMRFIIFPQALRHMIPVMVLLLAEMLKITSLAAIITYGDLAYAAGRVASDTFRPVEAYTVAAVIYFVMIFSLGRLANLLERRLSKRLAT